MANAFDLSAYEINVKHVVRNAPPARLYEDAVSNEHAAIADSGAIMVRSGAKTGRSPLDKRIVDNPHSTGKIWWGPVNIKLGEDIFIINRQRAIDYLNTRDTLYVLDGYAGWEPRHRLKIRIICARAYHALFMRNMLLRPTTAELAEFGDPDYVIFNSGQFPANPHTHQMTSRTSIDLSLERREYVILGTEYAGEMKKGVFTLMHYLLPEQGVLSMHCSANEGPRGDVSLFFGLSGTGKTTLSADPGRRLIGDDEHGWGDEGVFNIEGGCYAKCIQLSAAKEPEIYNAIRFGTVLENTAYDEETRAVDFSSAAITENTRAAYPIEFIPNAKIPCVGGHPRNIIFLTCDATGRAAAGEPADARPGHVSFHQRLHSPSRGHGNGGEGTAARVLRLLQRRVFGAPSDRVCRNARRETNETWGANLAGEYGLVGRIVWRRLADETLLHAGHHRCDP